MGPFSLGSWAAVAKALSGIAASRFGPPRMGPGRKPLPFLAIPPTTEPLPVSGRESARAVRRAPSAEGLMRGRGQPFESSPLRGRPRTKGRASLALVSASGTRAEDGVASLGGRKRCGSRSARQFGSRLLRSPSRKGFPTDTSRSAAASENALHAQRPGIVRMQIGRSVRVHGPPAPLLQVFAIPNYISDNDLP